MPLEARALACCCTIREFTILAKLFQEFHPMGAAEKHAVAEAASRNRKRTRARYHRPLLGRIRTTMANRRLSRSSSRIPLQATAISRKLPVLLSRPYDHTFMTIDFNAEALR